MKLETLKIVFMKNYGHELEVQLKWQNKGLRKFLRGETELKVAVYEYASDRWYWEDTRKDLSRKVANQCNRVLGRVKARKGSKG